MKTINTQAGFANHFRQVTYGITKGRAKRIMRNKAKQARKRGREYNQVKVCFYSDYLDVYYYKRVNMLEYIYMI